MKRFIKFPEIEQFRNAVQNVQNKARYVGYNEDRGLTIVNSLAKMPILSVHFTEKIHGTNASVCFSEPDGFWVQKRTDIITPENDNAACAFFATQNQEAWMRIIRSLAEEYKINLEKQIITVYFEFCGGSIQKKSAVTGLDKRSIIFEYFKVSPVVQNENEPAVWFRTFAKNRLVQDEDAKIWNICSFRTYDILIDFNDPEKFQNQMNDLVLNTIEPNSPVGQYFGIQGNVGEGVVGTFMYKDVLFMFKVKGEKHSNSRVKILKPVDDERLQKINDISQKVTPAWRLEQMFDLANDRINDGVPNIKNIGQYLKLVNNDILKEDADIIGDAGLEPKDIFGTVAKIAKEFYQEALNTAIFEKA